MSDHPCSPDLVTRRGTASRSIEAPVARIDPPASHVVVLAGDIDIARRPELSRHVQAFEASGSCSAVVDLSAVDYLDSTALQLFVRLQAVAAGRGGSVTLRDPNTLVRRILDVSGLAALFVLEH